MSQNVRTIMSGVVVVVVVVFCEREKQTHSLLVEEWCQTRFGNVQSSHGDQDCRDKFLKLDENKIILQYS